MSIKELDEKIEELKKEREIALLELEIKKIKKTVVEEINVQNIPWYPTYPEFNKYIVTC